MARAEEPDRAVLHTVLVSVILPVEQMAGHLLRTAAGLFALLSSNDMGCCLTSVLAWCTLMCTPFHARHVCAQHATVSIRRMQN